MSIELKPCPFCGGEAYFAKSVNGSNMFYCGCTACGVEFKALNVYQPTGEWKPTKDVIAEWNTRASVPEQPVKMIGATCVCGRQMTVTGGIVTDQPDEYTGLVEKLELMHCPMGDDAWEEMLEIIKEHMEARDIAQSGRAAREGSTQFKSAPIPEKYNQAASAIFNWTYCPECGCEDYKKGPMGGERQCNNCGQIWFPDVNYVNAVREHLAEHYARRESAQPVDYSAFREWEELYWLDKKKYPSNAECFEAGRQSTINDYEEVLSDHRRLVKEMDVTMNGDGAARQASLCDIVAQVKSLKREVSTQDHIICTDGSRVEIDPEYYPLLSQHNWYINMSGKLPYAITKLKTDQSKIWRCIFMHHLILGTSTQVDHIDCNSLNNRKANLRKATRQQNNINKPKFKSKKGVPCSSKYKGVHKYSKSGTFRACIGFNRKVIQLGVYKDEDDAARAYNAKAFELFGEYAWLNPVPAKSDSIEGGAS